MSRRSHARAGALLVVCGLAIFWAALLVAARANPGYSQRRDYISSLAAHGAHDAWLGVLAIASLGITGIGAALLLHALTRWGATAFLAAGASYLVVAVSRVDCSEGAAGCGLHGRFDIHGGTTITHWTAAVVANVLVLAGLVLVGLQLRRRRRGLAAAATFAAAAVTLLALFATGGQTPGEVQRAWILVMTAWLAAAVGFAFED